MPVNLLKPAEYNPRRWTEKDIQDTLDSLTEFELVEPIVVNSSEERKNVIIGGHLRYFVWKEKMGKPTIPVAYVNIPDVKKEQKLNLILNKLGGNWDWEKLANFDEDMLLEVGFDQTELDKIFKEATERPEVEFTQELSEEHNYIVLYFDNEMDWLQMQTLFPLQTVKALDSRPGFKKKGVGRVVKGSLFLNTLLGKKGGEEA